MCFRTEGYFPDECIVCQNLQLLWKDGHLLNLVKIWKTELKTTQKNRPKGWSYGQTFTKFFSNINMSDVSDSSVSIRDLPAHQTSDQELNRNSDIQSVMKNDRASNNQNPIDFESMKDFFHSMMTTFSSQMEKINSSNSKKRSRKSSSNSSSDSESASSPTKRRRIDSYKRKQQNKDSSSESENFSVDTSISAPSTSLHSQTSNAGKNSVHFSLKDCEVYGYFDNIIYLKYHPTIKKEGDYLFLDGSFKKVKWHSSGDAFTLVPSDSSEIMFIPEHLSYEATSSFLKKDILKGKVGFASRFISTDVRPNAAILKALNPFFSQEKIIMDAVIKKNWKQLNEQFKSSYTPFIGVRIPNGLLSCKDYKLWASPESISVYRFSSKFNFNIEPYCPERYIKAEKDRRLALVDLISSFILLEEAAEMHSDPQSSNTRNFLITILKSLLIPLKFAVTDWIKAKVDIRKIVLQDSQVPLATELMKSSPWCPELFPDNHYDILVRKDTQNKSIPVLLGWSKSKNDVLKASGSKIDASYPGLIKSTPSQSSDQTTSNISSSNKNKSKFYRKRQKPFRGSRKSDSTFRFRKGPNSNKKSTESSKK